MEVQARQLGVYWLQLDGWRLQSGRGWWRGQEPAQPMP